MDEEQFDDVKRLAEQLERIGDATYSVRMECTFYGKHSGPIRDDQTQIYNATELGQQLRDLMKAARDAQGFQAVMQAIVAKVVE